MRTELHRLKDKMLLVSPHKLLSLRTRSAFSSRIKIGFGPIKTGENDLNVRAWRIDPIVSEINRTSAKYIADIYFEGDDLRRFDIVIVVKVYGDAVIAELRKAQGKQTVIFDIVDNPHGCKRNFYDDVEFHELLKGVIISSPLQLSRFERNDVSTCLIEHPVISRIQKADYSATGNQITIIWQGYQFNRGGIVGLESVVERASRQSGATLKLVYHTNLPASVDGNVQYLPWTSENAFSALIAADIAVAARDSHQTFQAEKPSTKVIMYMGVGLPLICNPTAADELVIENGKTGFLARNEDEWVELLSTLALDAELRESVGRAAYNAASRSFSVSTITKKYLSFIESVHQVSSTGVFREVS